MGFISEEYHTKIVKDLTVDVTNWKIECKKVLDKVQFWKESHDNVLNLYLKELTNNPNSSLNGLCCDKVTSNENREGQQKLGCCVPNVGLSKKHVGSCENALDELTKQTQELKMGYQVDKVRKVKFFCNSSQVSMQFNINNFLEKLDYEFAQPKLHYSSTLHVDDDGYIENVMVEYFVKREG